jgi:hypothetical protein
MHINRRLDLILDRGHDCRRDGRSGYLALVSGWKFDGCAARLSTCEFTRFDG